VQAKATDFSWATVVDALLPPTPTPPANPPASPPEPQVVPDLVFAAISSAVIEPTVQLDSADTALKVMKRKWKDADVYLFFNEGNQETVHTVTLFSNGHDVKAWDPQSGTKSLVEPTREGGHLAVQLKMHPYETRLLVVR
jgi:hypothetical protein